LIVKSVQDIATISSVFRENLIAWLAQASNGITDFFAQTGHFSNELCVGSTCVTAAQFQAMVAASAQSPSTGQSSPSQSAPTDSSQNSSATTTPPTVIVNGDNPATVDVGATYSDLGASIAPTSPVADLNLGIAASVDGATSTPLSGITIDTSTPGSHSIRYIATDQNGLEGTAQRTVNVIAPDASTSPAQ
ncbi:MAG TPA: immunoglobulin-like domain-containing protein, partial [Candidatus Paceibacterota bacterium]|nr:immunoglobulin-like domain-containing protein [Candidatus Paceibacterota bacterium]